MSLKVCQDCGTWYAPADTCPQCGGGVYRFSWEEEEMAKATSGGASDYAAGPPVGDTPEPVAEKPARKPRVSKADKAAIEAEMARLNAELNDDDGED